MAHFFDLQQRKTIMFAHRDYNGSYFHVKKKFQSMHPGIRVPSAPTVRQIAAKFDATSKLQDLKRTGRPTSALDKSDNVRTALENDPKLSVRKLSLRVGLSVGAVHNIIRKNIKWKPYKPQIVQKLYPEDYAKREKFCREFLDRCDENPDFLDSIIWTDESVFKTSGRCNRKNNIYWSARNRHLTQERPLVTSGVSVWAGVSSRGIIGPFLFDGTVDGQAFRQVFENEIYPSIHENGMEDFVYQQDGAPAHWALESRQCIARKFPLWIGRGGPIAWPPRSPDLTPMDFSVWGNAKDFVYKSEPQTNEDMVQLMRDFFDEANDPDSCKHLCRSVVRRYELCVDRHGGHIEPYLKHREE